MARLLVTGGAGFIGSNFVHHWVKHHPDDRVVVLDALTYAGRARNIETLSGSPNLHFVRGDIRDGAAVEHLLRAEGIDTLVNFAAESHVDRSIASADEFVQTNIVGTYSLLEAARKVWLREGREGRRRFHQVSTDEVYGSIASNVPPAREGGVYAPNSPYAASKAAADHLVRACGRTHGLPVTTSHSCNNYGPRQHPEKLVPRAIVNLLAGREMPVYGDGGNQREWLHVHDHCRGLERVLLAGEAGEVYHLGGGESMANLDLLRLLARLVDARFARDPDLARRFPGSPAARGESTGTLLRFVPDRPGHDRRYSVSGEKARRLLGFTPEIDLERGLDDTVAWYLSQPDGVT